MADRSDRSRITVPPGFRELLGSLCREILRHQPKNIIEFSAQYFEQKLRERDGENRILLRPSTSRDMIQNALESGQITSDIEDKAAIKIQAAFRGHSTREHMKQSEEDQSGEQISFKTQNKSQNQLKDATKQYLTTICFQPYQNRESIPTPHFDEDPTLKSDRSDPKLILLDHDSARIVPLLDPSSVADCIDSALIAAKLREFASTIYVQSPLGAVAIRPSKIARPMPLFQTTLVRTASHPTTKCHYPPLPRLLLLNTDGSITSLKVVDRDECTVVVAHDRSSVAPCSEYLVVPLSGPEVASAESDSRAEPRHLASLPSPASLSQYISLRLQRHIGPTGSFHRRSLAALRSSAPKADASGSSESSFLVRDSRSFALPPPPPNTPVPSLGDLDPSVLGESDSEFLSATSISSFLVPPPPPNTPASSIKSSGTSSVVGVESRRMSAAMSAYLSDSRIEAEAADMGAGVGRDTLSAPDVTMPPELKVKIRTNSVQQSSDK